MTNNIIESVRRILTDAGLVPPDELDMSGNIAMCGTTKKPNGTDGRYKVHLDPPQSVWTCNHHDGGVGRTVPLYGKDEPTSMPEVDRRALAKRVRREKEEAAQRHAETHQAAAERAEKLFASYSPASKENPYLSRKQCLPVGNMRECAAEASPYAGQLSGVCLVVPLMNVEGQLRSLQYIDVDGNKRFLKDGEKAGCFFPIPAKDGGKNGPLLIGEGVATVASACMATGYAGLVAFDCGNPEPVAKAIREKCPGRELIILADNDCTAKDGTPVPDDKNPGVVSARKAARAVRGKVAVCPAIHGLKADFNDVHVSQGLDAVKAVIEQARQQKAMPPLPAGFFYSKKDGALMFEKVDKRGNTSVVKVCRHIEVIGRTCRSDGSAWGVLLEWKNRRGETRRLSIPSRLFQQQGTALPEFLADEGLDVEPGRQTAFKHFVLGFDDLPIIRNVDRVGWVDSCFVLPDETIGTAREEVILQTTGEAVHNFYQTAGTLEGWQQMVELCAGNTRLEFSLALSFAAPLLAFVNMDGSIFNLEGGSSCGKTTALKVAASAWGDPSFHVRTWRVTDNGFESICPLFNDNILVLDELGQIGGRALGEVAYMFANGTGKTRAARNGGAQAVAQWRSMLLSSGELGLAAKLNEDGLKARAGQEVRFIGVSMCKEHLENLHGREPGQLIHELNSLPLQHYGHAGRAFLRELTAGSLKDVGPASLKLALDDYENSLCPKEADPQVCRVARRFALVCVAGSLARSCNILPVELDIEEAVRSCFNDWLSERGGAGAREDAAILAQVKLFLEQNGQSRFQDITREDAFVDKRVGFRQTRKGGVTGYLILKESFRSVVAKGFDPRRALQVLRREGWLHADSGRYDTKVTLPGMGRRRVYILTIPPEEAEN